MSELKPDLHESTSNKPDAAASSPVTKQIGRNEPCPCKSGKKYKRCCGMNAAPKLSTPAGAFPSSGLASDAMGSTGMPDLSNMDPQMMMQISQSLQRLPKGQLQRLQAIMQKAMNGKDVTAEAQEFERTLPKEFKEMMQGFSASYGATLMQNMQAGQESAPVIEAESLPSPGSSSSGEAAGSGSDAEVNLTEEQARALVAKAAAEGMISKEQAEALLKDQNTGDSSSQVHSPENPEQNSNPPAGLSSNQSTENSKLTRFWRSFAGKK